MKQSEFEDLQRRRDDKEAEAERAYELSSRLGDELDALDQAIEDAEIDESVPGAVEGLERFGLQNKSDKGTEERYLRTSVNWGTIAVHPTDLFAVYGGLSYKRAEHIVVNQGGQNTRTTGVALAIKAVSALLSNGYNPEEVAVILAAVAAG